MAEYIEREALLERNMYGNTYPITHRTYAENLIKSAPAADVVEVVRCKDCCFAVPFDRHCEINSSGYRHCLLLRGDETRNVWHKYTKYYKDYSIVELDEFCSEGKPHKQALGMKEGADNGS